MYDKVSDDIMLYEVFVEKANDEKVALSSMPGNALYDLYIDSIVDFLDTDFYLPSDIVKFGKNMVKLSRLVPARFRKAAREVFILKNRQRGGLWRDVGAKGACIELHAKLSRLNFAPEDEDSYIDLFNYCAIAFMCCYLGHIAPATRKKKVAIVTGDHEGGLGFTLAETLRLNGYSVPKFGRYGTVEAAKSRMRAILEDLQRVDVLINNYGINKLAWIGEMDRCDYEDVIDINLKAPLAVTNELVAWESCVGKVDEWCKILNICSQTYRVPQRTTSAYCASKAGLAHMTRVMARELGPKGYIVNGIAPGLITDTIMSQKTNDQVRELRGWSFDHMDDYAKKLIPIGRYTNKEEVSLACMKLIHMPTYVNGSILDMTGGQ